MRFTYPKMFVLRVIDVHCVVEMSKGRLGWFFC